MNKSFVTAVSYLVNTQDHLQMKFKSKISSTFLNGPSVLQPARGQGRAGSGRSCSPAAGAITHVENRIIPPTHS